MKTTLPLRVLSLFFLAWIVSRTAAQIPQMIAYQGRVSVDGVSFNGAGQFKFALVNGAYTGGAGQTVAYWTHDGTGSTTDPNVVPAGSVAVACDKGLYSVLLGNEAAGMTPVPPSVFTSPDVRLRVWFNDGTHGFQKLSPDQRIASAGYAMIAHSVADGAITASKIADGAITAAKLAQGAVGFSQLSKPVQSGRATVTLAWTTGVVDVTFPQPFAETPIVHATLLEPTDSTTLNTAQVTAVSPTGCSVRVLTNAAAQVIHYSDDGLFPGGSAFSAETLGGEPVCGTAYAIESLTGRTNAGSAFFLPGEDPWTTALAMVNGARALAATAMIGSLERRIIRFFRESGGALPQVVALDQPGLSPLSPALLEVNGAPCIFFLDTAPNLRMIRANDANGTTWGSPITIATGVHDGFASRDKVLAVKMIDGRAAVAFNTFTGLRYVRATDAAGTVWGPSVLVDAGSAGSSGMPGLDDVSGRPGIAWFSVSGGRLKFARANDAAGTSWPAPVTIATGVNSNYVILTSVAGMPAVCIRNLDTPSLTSVRFVRARDATGSSWTPLVNLTAADARIANPFMVLHDGRPAFFTGFGNLVVAPELSGTVTWMAQAP